MHKQISEDMDQRQAARYATSTLRRCTRTQLIEREAYARSRAVEAETLVPGGADARLWSWRVDKCRLALLDLDDTRKSMPSTYQRAIEWIVKHEEHATHNPLMQRGEPLDRAVVATYLSVALVSDLFGRDSDIVVQDVVRAYARLQHRPQLSVADVRRSK